MPSGDRTGPMGMGPMTGRRAGYCVGNSVPGGFAGGMGLGRGMGRGGRGGRGYRNQFYATGLTGVQRSAAQANVPPAQAVEPQVDELAALQAQADQAAATLQQIQQRIDQLSAQREVPPDRKSVV